MGKNTSELFMQGVLIPNGIYKGVQTGYEVNFLHADHRYFFTVESGIRGIKIPVEIKVINTPEGFSAEVEVIKNHD